jgi:hypothetical protein
VEVLCLVPLVGCTGTHKVSDDQAVARHMEIDEQAMQRLGDAFVTRTMGHRKRLLETQRGRRQVDAVVDDNQAVLGTPPGPLGAVGRGIQQGAQVRRGRHFLAQAVEEVERGTRQRHGPCFLSVVTRQGIRYHIRLEFNIEIEPNELASPLVLGNCRQALI